MNVIDGQAGIIICSSLIFYSLTIDNILNIINSNYVNGTATGYVKNSTDKGNYTGTIETTGSSVNYAVNNIYDMAGNVNEWTMEAYFTGFRVRRGGNFDNTGSNNPASGRNSGYSPDFSNYSIGFRVALYL